MIDRAKEQFAKRSIETDQVLVIPLPFTTFAWKAIAIQPDTYTNLYLPLVETTDTPIFYTHKRWPNQLTCAQLDNYPAHNILNAFTKGFYSLSNDGKDHLVQADLRMGMTPNYVFKFELQNKPSAEILAKRVASARSEDGDFSWLTSMITGKITARPAEQNNILLNSKTVLHAQARQTCSKSG